MLTNFFMYWSLTYHFIEFFSLCEVESNCSTYGLSVIKDSVKDSFGEQRTLHYTIPSRAVVRGSLSESLVPLVPITTCCPSRMSQPGACPGHSVRLKEGQVFL